MSSSGPKVMGYQSLNSSQIQH